MCSPISVSSACPVSRQMNMQFARCWFQWKSTCIWMSGHILKRNLKRGQNTFPLSLQSNSLSSCTVPYLFKEEWTRVGKAARKTRALGNLHEAEAPGEPLAVLLASVPQPWLLGLERWSSKCSWDFPRQRAAQPQIIEQPPVKNTECYQSAFMWVPWKGFGARRGWGLWRSKGETGQEKLLSVFWVTLGDHGDVYSQLRAERPLVQINVLSRSGSLSTRQLPLIWSKEVTARTHISNCN